jgi:hypothetical protein
MHAIVTIKYDFHCLKIIAAVGSTLFLTTDFDVMTRASFLDRVITMQLDSKYRRNLVFSTTKENIEITYSVV